MDLQDTWSINKNTEFLDRRENIKNEFSAPCREKYNIALNAIKFLCLFHDCNAIFDAIKVDIENIR